MVKNLLEKQKKKLAKNRKFFIESFIAFLVRSFSAVISFLMNAAIGRYLGANESGYFFLALTFITVLSAFCRMGSDNILLRHVSIHKGKNEWNNVQSVIKILMLRTMVVSLAVTVVFISCTNLLTSKILDKPQAFYSFFWMGLSIPFYAGYMLLSYSFQGIRKSSYTIIFQGTLLPALLIIFVIIFQIKAASQLSFTYFGISVFTFLSCYLLWRRKSEGTPTGYLQKKQLIDETKPLRTIIILQPVIQLLTQFVAGHYIKSADLAQLAVAQRTSLLISFILIAINLVSAPKFASYYHENDMENLKKYVKTVSRLLFLISTPLTLVVFIFADFIMKLFGKDFAEGAILLRILALGQFVNLITGSVGYLLMMTGHQKQLRNVTLFNGFMTFVLIFFLTPRYGAIGSAIANAIGVATVNLMGVRLVKRKLGINTLSI